MSGPNIERLRAVTASVVQSGPSLWSAGSVRRARWIEDAMRKIRAPDSALGRTARDQLVRASGLSPSMVDWALESTLSTISEASLLDLDARCAATHLGLSRARPGQLAIVVLAGNVFTAAVRGVVIPLLFGWPVLAKSSSHEEVFASLLELALHEADPELGGSFRAVNLASSDEALTQVLFEQADAVSVYGGDNTLNTIRSQLSATVAFIPHGHGLGVSLIGKGALGSEARAVQAATSLASDVAAYDQRGCLSPHVAWVLRDQPVAPARFAELTFEALGEQGKLRPRGPLPMSVANAQLTFRAQAAMRGTLLEGDGYSVAHEPDGVLRVSPGYRNLLLLELDHEAEISSKLTPLGTHLKCLGVSGVEDVDALIAALPARVAPRVCALGEMQTPALCSLADGVPPWEGLIRLVDR